MPTFRVGADGETGDFKGLHSVQLKPRPLRKPGLFFEADADWGRKGATEAATTAPAA
jgi:hypothetical protein